MKKEHLDIDGRNCIVHASLNPKVILLQPVDSHDIEELSAEIDYIKQNSGVEFVHVAIPIERWNAELTPWEAPPVFGKIPFGSGAADTLKLLVQKVVPTIQERFSLSDTTPTILGGYSLAGLFSLWSAYQAVPFIGVVAASPSAWYRDWLEYAAENTPKVKVAYLSLGDKEDRTKTKIMAGIKDAMARQEAIFKEKGLTCVLEWNAGNHFQDNGERTAKGFVWVLERVKQQG